MSGHYPLPFLKLKTDQLRKFLSGPVLLAFDLDGTLIPIKSHFKSVRMSPSTRQKLEDLAKTHKVAIISGRPIKDLKSIVKSDKFIYVGNHGLEGVGPTPRYEKIVRNWRGLFERALSSTPGFIIEDKKITLTLHYRMTKNKTKVRRQILKLLKALNPAARVILGKLVFNLIPNVGENKGSALLKVMKKYRCKKAFFIGDDSTDEDVFIMRKKNIMTVRVGNLKTTHALYNVPNQRAVEKVLKKLQAL